MTAILASVQALLLSAALTPATAQSVLVRVLAADGSIPVFGAMTHLVRTSGEAVKAVLTDERGRGLFIGVAAGTYRLRVEMIGMATVTTEPFAVAEGQPVSRDVRLRSSAIRLEGLEVQADSRCSVRPAGEGLAVATVWEEARKALSAAALTDAQDIYRYGTALYERRLTLDLTVLEETEARREAYMRTPFTSLTAERLAREGFVQPDGLDLVYYAPDAAVLLSDVFLDTHCFRLARGGAETEGLIGLAFEPIGESRRVIDIGGTMWIDETSAELRWLEFTYRHLDPDVTTSLVGGRVDFRRMPGGTWIVPEWWIRMPAIAERLDATSRRNRYVHGYFETGGVVREVHEGPGRRLGPSVETGAIEGVVRDSIGFPRQGVRVGVVGSNQEVFTNAEGRYGITGLRPGRYRVQFVDPALETFGYVPPPETRDVVRGEAGALDQHLPSIGDVLFEACRGASMEAGSATVVGMVRDEGGRPLVGARVRLEWTSYTSLTGASAADALREHVNGFEATPDARGFYRFCGVPAQTTLRVMALSGDAESEVHEVRVDLDDHAVVLDMVVGRNGRRPGGAPAR